MSTKQPKAKPRRAARAPGDHERHSRAKPIDWAALAHKPAKTIPEFCASWNICTATFWNWDHAGHAPEVLRIGGRTLITRQAEARWLREQEAKQQPARPRGLHYRAEPVTPPADAAAPRRRGRAASSAPATE